MVLETDLVVAFFVAAATAVRLRLRRRRVAVGRGKGADKQLRRWLTRSRAVQG